MATPAAELPFKDVHAPPDTAPDTTSQPKTGEDKESIVQMVNRLLTEAKRHREPYLDRNGMEYYKFYRGEQWDRKRPAYRASAVVNLVYANINTIMPILTDTRPRVVPIPPEPSDMQFNDLLSKIIDYAWTQQGWATQLNNTLLDALVYSAGFWRIEWNKEANSGLGEVLIEAVDPFYCFPDPCASDINAPNSRYFIYAEPVTLGEIRKQYPDKAHLFQSDIATAGARAERTEIHDVQLKSPVDGRTLLETKRTSDPFDSKTVLKIHCWMKDDATEEYVRENEDGEKIKSMKKKWPNGRYIVVAGREVCEDRENPYADGKVPYVRFVNGMLPREFWGISEVEPIKELQIGINKVVSYILDHVNIMGNPAWIVDSNAGFETELLNNQPGLIIEKNPGSEVRREPGAPMPPHVFQILDRIVKYVSDISGIHESIRGRLEAAITSGLMLQSIQEAAQAPLRFKERMMSDSLVQAGQLIVSRIMQFYGTTRVVRLTNDQTGWPEYFQFSVEDKGGRNFVAKFKNLNDPNQPVAQEVPVKGIPDVKITTGSTMPFAKAQKSEMAIRLYQNQIIDREEVLKAVDWPNFEEVMSRMDEKEAQAAELAAAQEGAPPNEEAAAAAQGGIR